MGSSFDKKEEFVKAYDQHADAIFRYCHFRISNRELAKDLTQETFTKAWKYIADGKEIENIKAFLFKIAGNLVIDEYRKVKQSSLEELQERDGFDVESKDDEKIVFSSEVERVRLVIEELPDKYKEVITMRYVSDLSPKEIAEAIGESENVVSVRLNRAVKKMRELLRS